MTQKSFNTANELAEIKKNFIEQYNNIVVENDDGDSKKKMMLKKFFELLGYTQTQQQRRSQTTQAPNVWIEKAIHALSEKIKSFLPDCTSDNCSKTWFTCYTREDCRYDDLKRMIDHELKSTFHILSILSNSIISPSVDAMAKKGISERQLRQMGLPQKKEDRLFVFHLLDGFDQDKNAVWKEGKDFIQIKESNPKPQQQQKQNQKLIYAAGPTSAGKTFWLETLVALCKKSDKDFPLTFLNLDGGRFRELSLVYQLIKWAVRAKGFEGMNNLVNPSSAKAIMEGTLFKSSVTKKNLKHLIRSTVFPKNVSIIIPDTLSTPFFYEKTFREDLSLVGNDAQLVYCIIYQHFRPDLCVYGNNSNSVLQCAGTEPSGISRQKGQGKKFSRDISGWYLSMRNSVNILKSLERLRPKSKKIIVHNCGKPEGISVINDFSLDPILKTDKPRNILGKAIYFNKDTGHNPTQIQQGNSPPIKEKLRNLSLPQIRTKITIPGIQQNLMPKTNIPSLLTAFSSKKKQTPFIKNQQFQL